jgi:hypothetical protein
VAPGASFTYDLIWTDHPLGSTYTYDGWFTYKVATLHHTEYLSLDLFGDKCTGICPTSNPPLVIQAHNKTTAPTFSNGQVDFGSDTSNPEIGWTASGKETPTRPGAS